MYWTGWELGRNCLRLGVVLSARAAHLKLLFKTEALLFFWINLRIYNFLPLSLPCHNCVERSLLLPEQKEQMRQGRLSKGAAHAPCVHQAEL